jgi:K+-sensing histidine kinase KdpD
MQEERDELLYLGLGSLAAVTLGAALIPLREITSASNLTFAFLALTIVVAEFGGRWAAVATALASALSLDFFLTRPYLRLTMQDKHDVIAFVGLAVCGLVAAAFGSQRAARNAALQTARQQLAALHEAAAALERPTPAVESALSPILDQARAAFRLAAVVLRDADDQVLAASTAGRGPLPPPTEVLDRDALAPAPARWGRQGHAAAVPAQGGRIMLVTRSHRVGWLDVWGGGGTLGASSWRALGDLARLLAAALAAAPGGRPTRA